MDQLQMSYAGPLPEALQLAAATLMICAWACVASFAAVAAS